MAELKISGNIKLLKAIERENRLRASKYNLKVTLTEGKKAEAPKAEPAKPAAKSGKPEAKKSNDPKNK
jgi:hypothetical protein